MDKLSSFVEGLVSHLGRAYLLAGFLPALILVAVNQYLIFGAMDWNLFPEVTEPVLGLFTGNILTTVVVSLVVGLMLIVLNSFIIRMYEGLVPGVKSLLFPLYMRNMRRYRDRYAPIAAKHTELRELLAQKEESGEEDAEKNFAIYDELHRLHGELEKVEPIQTLPYERPRVSPTAFGNAWAIMEEYPLRRYGMDGMLFWPYVREVISQKNERLLDEIDGQKQVIDVVVNLSLVMLILAIEGLVVGVLRFQWQMFALAAIAFVLFLVIYQSAVSYTRTLSTLITKAYDFYRLPVLQAFGLRIPDDLDEEYWAWTRLSAFLRRGEPFYFEMLTRKGASSDDGDGPVG